PPVENDRIDYGAGAFVTTIDLRPCAERCLDEGGHWGAYLRATTGSVSVEIPVRRLIRSSSAGVIPAGTHPDGHRLLVDWRMGEPLEFEVATHQVTVSAADFDGERVHGELQGPSTAEVEEIELVNAEGESATTAVPTGDGDDPVRFSLPVPQVDTSELSPDEFVAWDVRARLRSGEQVPVANHAEQQLAVTDTVTGACGVERTRDGFLAVRAWRVVALADSAAVDDDGVLHLEGRVHGAGATEPMRLRLRGRQTVRFSDQISRADDGTFTVAVPLEQAVGRFGSCALPTGAHDAAMFVGEESADQERVPVLLSERAGSRLPIPVSTDRLEGRLIRGPENRVRLHLDRPLGEARGRYRQHQLRTAGRQSGELRKALLIRSYFGESATCNGVGIVRELRERGSDLDVFWSVRDHSVPVPDGAEPVVMRSREWYDLLGSAEYYLDNMFQPTFHSKPPGQVLIQTFHGYPFKTMGREHWAQTVRSPQAIEDYERRAAEWDYLISPAAYATPLLRRDFAYDGDVLEIGYPRNDVLVGPEAAGIRSTVRELLGIRPDQQAILYAPTFRDYESPDDFRAAMVDFLDLNAVADALGDDGVLLVRGHAFNARAGQRVGERPGVVDVTGYPEVSDLYLAADAAIVDYSSLRFDFAVTGKPMIFHVPDLERYRETRGWVVDFEPTAPGPHVSTTDEVIDQVRDLGRVTQAYREQYERFRHEFIELEDGRASARFVDAVMVPRGDAPSA
ncbi:MAG: CDP-glycerol glycerophosphotransferase family protein, partial [Actinomycetia bacterium]|nr:CDP-glycerol glycerophosphotransferase family protein [Actinomycetes bacterium]